MTEPGTPDVQNLYARLGTGAPHCALPAIPTSCRWATRPRGPAAVRRRVGDGVLYGRGAADMKGAIACFVAAALDYLRANGGLKRGSLSFLITGDEEAVAINGTRQGARLDEGARRDAGRLRGRRADELQSRGRRDQDRPARHRQCRADRARQAGPLRLSAARRQPDPKLARMHRPAVVDAARRRHARSFQPSNVQATVDLGAQHARPTSSRRGAGAINIRYNNLHTRADDRSVDARAVRQRRRARSARAISLTFSGNGDVFLTEPGPLVETMREAVQAVTGRDAGADHQRRHVGRALHLRHCPVIESASSMPRRTRWTSTCRWPTCETLTQIYRRFIEGYFVTV